VVSAICLHPDCTCLISLNAAAFRAEQGKYVVHHFPP